MDIPDMQIKITQHDEQIKTLFKNQEDLRKLTETVQDLGKSTMVLAESVKTLRGDVDEIKDANKFKARQIWTTVATGVLSALVGYIMAMILR